MRERYLFTFDEKVLEKFNKKVPSYYYSRVIRDFLNEEYELPENLDTLLFVPDETKQKIIILDEKTNNLIDSLVNKANNTGVLDKKVGRSHILRDVMKKIIHEKNEKLLSRLAKRKTKATSFFVEKGTIETLNKHISEQDVISTIEAFIVEEYQPPTIERQLLKEKPKEKELYRVNIDQNILNLLDDYAATLDVKGLKRSDIFRDATKQLVAKLTNKEEKEEKEERSIEEMRLDKELKKVVSEYVQVAGVAKVKERINQYLKD